MIASDRSAFAVRASLVTAVCVMLAACGHRSSLPPSLAGSEWWELVEALSEPPGAFELSDNLVSNEPHFAERVRFLRPSGGAYIGVGPEQNFSYIAALRPEIAFVVDIRRENRDLHVMYKALFELSADRVDFVSRLFSRPRPPGLNQDVSVDEIFERYDAVRPSAAQHSENLALIRERLLTTREVPLARAELESIERAFTAFYDDGPAIHFWGDRAVDAVQPSYRELMTARDASGRSRSFLASEDTFQFVKALHTRNMIVPVVGDFGGSGAIRRVAEYLRSRGAVVSGLYASNVSVYLTNQQALAFCRNLMTLPIGAGAQFIESNRMTSLASKRKACSPPSN